MTMFWLVVLLLITGGMALAITGPVDAQESPTPAPENGSGGSSDSDVEVEVSSGGSSTPTPQVGEDAVRVDRGLVLVDLRYEDGTAFVTLRNEQDSLMSVTLTDAGALTEGSGEIPRKVETLQPGEHTLTLPATKTDSGMVGVTIGTKNVLYGAVIEDGNNILDPPEESDRMALGIGVVSTVGFALIIKRRKDDLDDNGIRRIDS